MNGKKWTDYALIVMKNLNFIIILYLSLLMAYCLRGYVRENSAEEFLTMTDRIPLTAWKVPLLVVCLYVACLLLMYVRNKTGFTLFLKVLTEIVLCLLVSSLLGFSYTGILLLILADTVRYFTNAKWTAIFVAAICIVYLVINFDLLSVFYNVVPFDVYLEYFQKDVRSVLLGISNILNSLNTFLFFVYIFLFLSIQLSEKERMLSLNEQLNKTNVELQRATVQLEQYAKESEKMAETRERNRLAREIHDTLGHSLTGIITGIEACTALMDVAPDATKLQLKAIADVARQGITDVRRSVKALRPDALERADLASALMETIDEMRSATNVQIDYRCGTRLDCFNDDEEDIIYRIVQESITNSIRHGRATHIWIEITREYNLLKMSIRDDGIGCVNVKKGFGLHHMDERLRMLNGSLSYDGTDGFTIEAQIPIRWGNGGDGND